MLHDFRRDVIAVAPLQLVVADDLGLVLQQVHNELHVHATGRDDVAQPLAGFGKAFDGPPIDPAVLEAQQKKLEEQMQAFYDDFVERAAASRQPLPAHAHAPRQTAQIVVDGDRSRHLVHDACLQVILQVRADLRHIVHHRNAVLI